jgi:hypothetical protein
MESALPKSKRRLVIACEREINWFGEYRMLNVRQHSGELGKTLTLACPIMAGQVGQMLMGLADTLMVGHVGTVPLAGAAFGTSLVSVAFVFGIGLLSSVGVLTSQAHGARMIQRDSDNSSFVDLALIGFRRNTCHTACFASTMFLSISSTASRSGSGSTFHGDSWLVSCTRFGVYECQNLLRVSV